MRRVMWGSISSELLMCGGGVFMSVLVNVWGYVGKFVV